MTHQTQLTLSRIATPIGTMVAVANEAALYFLAFTDNNDQRYTPERLQLRLNATITPGTTEIIESLQQELDAYFNGTLRTFKTPYVLRGTGFRQTAWHALEAVAYGQTRSYAEQAQVIGKPSACRAVGSANGANNISIIVPCHRIITSDGKLGGYAGGIARKQWLIEHEKKHAEQI